MSDHGGDVDLGWRAQVVGARVLVAPAARVRHLDVEELRSVTREDQPVLEARDRVRAVLKNYSRFHLLRVVPQALFAALIDFVTGVFSGSGGRARAPVSAWTWNLRHLGELRPLRRRVQRARLVPDSDVRRLQVSGTARRAAAGDVELGEREGAITRSGRSLKLLRHGFGKGLNILKNRLNVFSRRLKRSNIGTLWSPGFRPDFGT